MLVRAAQAIGRRGAKEGNDEIKEKIVGSMFVKRRPMLMPGSDFKTTNHHPTTRWLRVSSLSQKVPPPGLALVLVLVSAPVRLGFAHDTQHVVCYTPIRFSYITFQTLRRSDRACLEGMHRLLRTRSTLFPQKLHLGCLLVLLKCASARNAGRPTGAESRDRSGR